MGGSEDLRKLRNRVLIAQSNIRMEQTDAVVTVFAGS